MGGLARLAPARSQSIAIAAQNGFQLARARPLRAPRRRLGAPERPQGAPKNYLDAPRRHQNAPKEHLNAQKRGLGGSYGRLGTPSGARVAPPQVPGNKLVGQRNPRFLLQSTRLEAILFGDGGSEHQCGVYTFLVKTVVGAPLPQGRVPARSEA